MCKSRCEESKAEDAILPFSDPVEGDCTDTAIIYPYHKVIDIKISLLKCHNNL